MSAKQEERSGWRSSEKIIPDKRVWDQAGPVLESKGLSQAKIFVDYMREHGWLLTLSRDSSRKIKQITFQRDQDSVPAVSLDFQFVNAGVHLSMGTSWQEHFLGHGIVAGVEVNEEGITLLNTMEKPDGTYSRKIVIGNDGSVLHMAGIVPRPLEQDRPF